MHWPKVTIESLKATTRYSLVGGPFGSELTTRDYVEEGVPVIRGVNLPGNQAFRDEDFVFIREEKADSLSANMAYPGDVVFTQRGTLGQVGLIPAMSRFPQYVISQSQMKLTVDPTKADARYIYYYFRHPDTIQKIKNHSLTSGVPHINLGILRDFTIPLPPIHTQKQILDVLSAYDDLIENNRRRITLLEEAARQLYQEWFVRLRFPGYEHERIKDGVPEDWRRVPLEDVLTLQRGFDLPTQDRQEGIVPILASTGIAGYHNKPAVKGPGVTTGRSGTLGRVVYISEDYWPLNTALWVREFKKIPPLYAYFLLQSLNLAQYNGGVSVPTLDRKIVHKIPVLLPKNQLLELFISYTQPLFDMLDTLRAQNERASAARDLLLPRLMNGESGV